MPVRAARSKTGCQACRRRKVRCDEQKPVCGACTRLQLPCFFQPGTGPAVETPRYRVRFVHSPYSPGQNGSVHAGSSKNDQGRHDVAGSRLRTASAPISSLLSGPSDHPDDSVPLPPPQSQPPSQLDAASTKLQRLDGARQQVLPLTPDPATPHSVSPVQSRSVVSLHRQTQHPHSMHGLTYESHSISAPAPIIAEPLAANADSIVQAGHVPTFFDLNMHFDLLEENWMAIDQPSDPSAPDLVAMTYTDTLAVHATPDSSSNPSSAPVSTPTSASASLARTPTPATPQVPVVIDTDDHVLIQHYLNVMSQYTKIRGSGDENIYTQIFSNMALFYAPLYSAIMAWTGLHLGQRQAESQSLPQPQPESARIRQAERRYDRAVSLLHDDQDVAHHFELSLVTIWFCLQFELLAARGIESFCHHLEFTADLVDAHRRHHRAGGAAVTLSSVGARVLVWLGTYDARATWIGGSGRLLHNLELFSYEHDFLAAAFPLATDGTGDGSSQASRSASIAASDGGGGSGRGGAERAGKRSDPPSTSPTSSSPSSPVSLPDSSPYSSSSLQTCLRLTIQFDAVDSRIAQLHQRSVPAPAAIWLALQSDLITAQQRLESRPAVAPILAAMFGSDTSPNTGATVTSNTHTRTVRPPSKITTHQFNDLLLLSACYTGIICFHRVLPAVVARDMAPQLRGLLGPQAAATRVLRIAAWVNRLRAPSPQNIWPRILFLAGIETTDPVYQDWVVRTLLEAEQWGGNMAKTRTLLQHIIRLQTHEGGRIDFLEAMRQTTGLFII
ncbi:c6 zinc finger domain containing protein [Grosmannia clavigera kw1407]|uniref:C6 zinc finger domain containing protein n=1 Tax=Grosmannia clavigera (strain kw1407 / UAMH 11150) TaxID=655863 RepID=F0X6L2_GROCL|nr:c6 zinc finger domain containing protein [Grosmannia clavigera kw1407]EFX06310.1 c6 zinc finger domain containing protein [Grosmannia clavigera kw1407]